MLSDQNHQRSPALYLRLSGGPSALVLTLSCCRCGSPAATFAFRPAGKGDGLWRDSDRLERTGFMGTVVKFGPLDSFAPFLSALQRGDYDSARSGDPDLVAFHCWTCNEDYCEKCWQIGPPTFDDDFPGFYDCTRGVCPEGHEQVVDD